MQRTKRLPYPRKNYKKYAKKPYKKTYKNYSQRNNTTSTFIQNPGAADSIVIPMKYTSQTYLSWVVSGYGSAQQYNATSFYRPDYTASAGDYQQQSVWALLYNHYTVLGSKIVITAFSEKSNTLPIDIAYAPMNYNVVPASIEYVKEAPYSKYGTLNVGSNDGTMWKSVHYMPSHKLQGVSKEAIKSEKEYSGTTAYTSAPDDVWYWLIMAQNFGSTLGVGKVWLNIELVAYTRFFSKKNYNDND